MAPPEGPQARKASSLSLVSFPVRHSQYINTTTQGDPQPLNMGGIALLVRSVALYCISVGLYKIFKWNFIKTGLDKVPGPPSQSLITGVFTLRLQ